MDDFAALMARALGRPLTPAEPIAVAVSGGPDSVALLLLAAAAFPGRTTALTVDHGLRPAAADEAANVARQCAAAGIPHQILHWTGAKPTANIQAAARAARYRLMADWCAAHGTVLLLTAHHADDQAETLLMRLARGSGSPGLAGIRARRDLGQGVTLVRPLLTVRRADLSTNGWQVANDPTNHDPHYDRTHARRLLACTEWLDPARLAAAASHLAQAEAALVWAADFAWAGRALLAPHAVRLDVAGLPDELVHRLTLRAIRHLNATAVPQGPAVTRLIARLHGGHRATIAGVAATGGPVWHFIPAPPRRKRVAE